MNFKTVQDTKASTVMRFFDQLSYKPYVLRVP